MSTIKDTQVMTGAITTEKYPSQIKYIVGNEACERYSYYGMRSILTIFLVQYLLLQKAEATSTYHMFAGACYFFPVMGAFISDRFWGKYKTILALSIVYCVGHLYLAIFEHSDIGFYTGLGLIALGSGGIKPCVSAHVGDQFKKGQEKMVEKIFELFYWMINFGSFFSTLITPWTLEEYGPGVAFGIPGLLMAAATFVFWLGRHEFVHVPAAEKAPTGFNTLFWTGTATILAAPFIHGVYSFGGLDLSILLPGVLIGTSMLLGFLKSNNQESFVKIVFSAIINLGNKVKGKGILSGALKKYDEKAVDGAQAVLGIAVIFSMITFFWALFDQHGSTWILQAKEMNLNFMGIEFLPSQIAALNPVMVMALIPIFSFGIYPFMGRFFEVTPLRKMGIGMGVAGFSFVMVAIIQGQLDAGNQLNVGWQFFPYLTITAAEVMVSITALEFAYTQAPRSMKSTIMSLFLLTVFFGNMVTSYVAATGEAMKTFAAETLGLTASGEVIFFVFFAIVMFISAAIFALLAKNYKMRNYLES